MESEDLAQRVVQNMIAMFTYIGQSPVVEFARSGKLSAWRTPVPHPWFNGIHLPGAALAGDEGRFDALVSLLGSTPYSVWPAHGIDRSGWDALLHSRGYFYETGAPGMAFDLSMLPESLDTPPGFAMIPVRDADALRLWCRTFILGYELPETWEQGFHRTMAQAGTALPLDHWLGLIDGEPVATSSVFDAAGVAGINFVSTVPAWRRRGLGGLMTLRPLYDARDRGLRHAVLSASDVGFPVYLRLGFEQVCRVANYHL